MDKTAAVTSTVVWGGFVLAFLFGAIAHRTNFCTMGAVSDVVNMGHWNRMRMWLLAIAVAIMGASLLQYVGLVDLSKSVYHRPTLSWLSLIVGGLFFGVGMTLAGGCANKNLVRVGGGSLRALVVLVFLGISAYMTLKGLFGQWRAGFLDPVTIDLGKMGLKDQSLASLLGHSTGLDPKMALLVTMVLVAAALLAFVFKDGRFRRNMLQVIGAMLLGVLVVAGWYLTGHVGFGEHPETMEMVYFATNTRTLESLSFVAPVAFSLELLMLWTDASLHVTFGIASAIGVILGSFVAALAAGSFRWEAFSSFGDLRDQLLGAVMMGFGGVTATGCTVGQGLTGVSTLAVGSFIALASIVIGCAATLKYILWRES